jgi:hypothetical protein
MLSLHRLTLAVNGTDDDGSVKRIRRRSKKRGTIRDPASHRRRLPFDWDSFDAGVGSAAKECHGASDGSEIYLLRHH